MRWPVAGYCLLVATFACGGSPGKAGTEQGRVEANPAPPVAATRDHQLVSTHGSRNDPYFWLRDDSREDAEVLAYINAENAYSAAMLAPTAALQQRLYDEMVARLEQADSTVPTFENGYWYYHRYEVGKDYPIFVRRKTSDGPEQILLDENLAARGHDFYSAYPLISPDGNLMAVTEDTVGRNQFRLRIVDLRTGKELADAVTNIQADLAWANDNQTLFYIETHPQTLLGYRLRRHRLGTDSGSDPLVYEEPDASFYMGLGRTKSDAYITILLSSTVSTEYRLIDADNPTAESSVVLPREHDHEYYLDHLGERFVIRTNWQARNFRLMAAPRASAGDRSTWSELIAHRDDALLSAMDVHRDFIAVGERSGGLRKVRVIPNQGASFLLDGEEATYMMSLITLPEADSPLVRYSYESMTTPTTTYELDVATGVKKLLKRNPVRGDFDPANYVTEYQHASARDGSRIPVSIVYRRGVARDGSAPLVQHGYGAYGMSTNPRFDSAMLSLLDRGVVFARAHVRGGAELGRAWYDDGRLLAKMNTFTDFIDVTRFLVDGKYAARDKVIATGGSAGGLLVGAVANLAPDEYRGVLAWVPFVDAVTTMLDRSIPLTSNEFDEWGNPEDKAYYDYILAYSPYDNVSARAYPAMLVTTGLWDSQVQYWEPVKWVAKLRAHHTGANPILLHTNMDAGHGGKSGRFREYRETARDYAWILHTFAQPDPRSATH